MNLHGLRYYTVDPKGRVTLPSGQAREHAEWTGIMLENCLVVVPAPIDQLTDEAARRVAFPVYPHPRTGRFQLPMPVRLRFGFHPGFDVYCTGMGGWMEYWNPATFAAMNGLTVSQGRVLAGGKMPAIGGMK
jgi:DNA-binding transcriptional regulator/RsmH inhibitor MraZ